MSTQFNSNVDALFSKMENFVTSKTVVGEPVYIGGIILMPLVDVSFGVGVGTYENNKDEADKSKLDAGGGGLGAAITPSAVIVVNDGNVQMVNVKNQDSLNKLIDLVPGVLSKFNFGSFGKKENSEMDNEESQNKE